MRSFPLFASLVLVASAQPAAPSLQNLISNSPFGSAAQAGAGPVAATPLEFRGTFVDHGERFFSVLDTASRRAEWVGLNEPGRPFAVKSYDPERESIVLEFQGRSMDLKLHSARITAAPMPQPSAPVAGNNAPQNVPGRPAQAAPSTTEAQRLAQVAEEIRRRRALRQQASQPGAIIPNAAPPPGNQPPSPLQQPR